jgi:hypothetical protein
VFNVCIGVQLSPFSIIFHTSLGLGVVPAEEHVRSRLVSEVSELFLAELPRALTSRKHIFFLHSVFMPLLGSVMRMPGALCDAGTEFLTIVEMSFDRLCGLVVRVPGYRS